MFEGATQLFLGLARQYGYLAVFLFLETSMLFPFLPSEVVVPFAAGLIVSDPVSLVAFAAVAAAAGVAGSLFAYYAFGEGGNRLVDRLDDYVSVSPEKVKRSREWFQRYGEHSVAWGRLLPVLRSVISVPAGAAHMSRGKFVAYTALGTFAFNAAVAGVVYYGKRRSVYRVAVDYAGRNPAVVALLVAAVVVTLLVLRRYDVA